MTELKKQDLIDLAVNIEDQGLRSKTEELLQNFELSNEKMDYEKSDLEKLPCWLGGHHYYEGGLIEHIYSVTKMCMDVADNLSEVYGVDIDRDSLISAALLHDLAKQFILEGMEGFRKCILDHNIWMACELYSRNFPEKVIEIVVGHGGETDQANPKSIEASILCHADSIDAETKQEPIEFGGSIVELEEI